jgi:hypothetical protein
VGDVEDGDLVLPLGAFEELNEVGLGVFVDSGEGFVEEEDGGFGGEGSGEGDALFFATGEAGGFAVEEVGDGHFGGEFLDGGVDGVGWGFLDAEGEADLVGNGHGGEEGSVLGDEAEAALTGGDAGDVAVVKPDLAVVWGAEAADDFDEGGFAGAGAAHEDGVGGGRDIEGDVFEGEGAGFPGDVLEADQGDCGLRIRDCGLGC